jgi:homoserine dehydrogenase
MLHPTPVLPVSEVRTAYYLRLRVADQKGVLSGVTGILAEHDISIDAMLQREPEEGEDQTDVIILTHEIVESRLRDAQNKLQALPTVLAPIVTLRKEELA